MRALRPALLLLGCCSLAAVRAQQVEPDRREPAPDLDFLEYLGAWADEDDEWLAVEEWRKDNLADAGKPRKPEKDAEESESERDDDDESK
jgi:hypothetical protein